MAKISRKSPNDIWSLYGAIIIGLFWVLSHRNNNHQEIINDNYFLYWTFYEGKNYIRVFFLHKKDRIRNSMVFTVVRFNYFQWRQTGCCLCCTCYTTFSAPPRNYIHKCATLFCPAPNLFTTCNTAFMPRLAPLFINIICLNWFMLGITKLV